VERVLNSPLGDVYEHVVLTLQLPAKNVADPEPSVTSAVRLVEPDALDPDQADTRPVRAVQIIDDDDAHCISPRPEDAAV